MTIRVEALKSRVLLAEIAATWIVAEWPNAEPADPAAVEEELLRLDDRPPTLLAFRESDPIGVLGYRFHRHPEEESQELWINTLFVAPGERGRGVGSHLLLEGVEQAWMTGRRRLFVYTEAPTFYESHHWRRLKVAATDGHYILERRHNGAGEQSA